MRLVPTSVLLLVPVWFSFPSGYHSPLIFQLPMKNRFKLEVFIEHIPRVECVQDTVQ